MALLRLMDKGTGQEIGRTEIAAGFRFSVYQDLREHGLLSFNGKRYRLEGLHWSPTTEELIVQGTFDSYEPGVTDCE